MRFAEVRRPFVGWLFLLSVALLGETFAPTCAHATEASVSTWDAADFRVWGFVPYWVSSSQLNGFPADGIYDHVSDVLYFGGVRPKADGSLHYISGATTELATLKSHAASQGFRLHMSMFEVYDPATNNNVDTVWNGIGADPVKRATFVSSVKSLLQSNNMSGFNFDYERPNTDSEWANYTQLAKDLRTAINPLGMEISVDDYGSTDSDWDDSSVFDARAYDQLFMMAYHYGASSNASFANGKLALTGQGAAKAFKDEQLVIGIGTWGTGSGSTKTLKSIAAATPDLAYDASTWSDGTNTWNIVSRKQARENTQLALNRNMAGMMSWTLHYDATNELGLHRVMHHYIVFQKGIPDLNLDGKVNATDANALADKMGTVPGWTGTNTAARFDDFYLSGNWEQGDRDGNGFVNQLDANWLASRFTTLGVTLPDRLAYSGTFENFSDSQGLSGRWRGIRDGSNLRETGNYTQHGAGFLTFNGSGAGIAKHSNSAVTIRNQNAAEAFDTLNTLDRAMQVDLETPIDLSENGEAYFTFLVRENTAPLLSAHLSSPNRALSLEFLDGAGNNQFDFTVRGSQQQVAINSQADAGGEDLSAGGFSPNTTYMVVGKISGNGDGANTMQASWFASGSTVDNFTNPSFPWMLTANSSESFNPTITQLQFTSAYVGNFTVSNIWIGDADSFFAATAAWSGDFNGDGIVNLADYVVWRNSLGLSGAGLAADGNGDGTISEADLGVWSANMGRVLGGAGSSTAVPEPSSSMIAMLAFARFALVCRRRRGRLLSTDRNVRSLTDHSSGKVQIDAEFGHGMCSSV